MARRLWAARRGRSFAAAMFSAEREDTLRRWWTVCPSGHGRRPLCSNGTMGGARSARAVQPTWPSGGKVWTRTAATGNWRCPQRACLRENGAGEVRLGTALSSTGRRKTSGSNCAATEFLNGFAMRGRRHERPTWFRREGLPRERSTARLCGQGTPSQDRQLPDRMWRRMGSEAGICRRSLRDYVAG